MKVAYLDCFSGISGDMFLGALVDAGVPLNVLQEAVDRLHLGATLDLRRVDRSGIDAAKIDVLTAEGDVADKIQPVASGHSHAHDHDHPHNHDHAHSHDHPHVHGRSLSVIQDIIRGSGLAIAVQAMALKAFELLGHAESKIHNVPVESIHFHEVGAVDAIADIVAVAAGCHWLQVERWQCSTLNVGGGHVHCAHGMFPVPAPATLELLRDLPIYSSGVKKELITPTGAALLRALDVTSSNFPAMSMKATGYGAGSRDTPGQPNVLRLVVGETAAKNKSSTPEKITVSIIETVIDDATAEVISYVADRLLAAGASDVYRTHVQMKKGRTGTHLTVLCSPSHAPELQRLLFRESTTLGLRYREEQKVSLDRRNTRVHTTWGDVTIKIGMLQDGSTINYAPEYEECRAIAEKHAIPLKVVMQAAMAAYGASDQASTADPQETLL